MDSYTEQIIKTKNDNKGAALKAVATALTITGIMSMVFINFIIGVIMLVTGMIMSGTTGKEVCMEYEYLFVNGDCEIARIINKARRKNEISFTEGEVERVLLYKSDKFQNELDINSDLVVKDYTSRIKDNDESWYVFMLKNEKKKIAVVMELNEKNITHVKDTFKRKVEDK